MAGKAGSNVPAPRELEEQAPAQRRRALRDADGSAPPGETFQPEERTQDFEPDLGARYLDRMLRAGIARCTSGISPTALFLAYADWALNFSLSPGKQVELAKHAGETMLRFGAYAGHRLAGQACAPLIEPLPHDKRFLHEDWVEASG